MALPLRQYSTKSLLIQACRWRISHRSFMPLCTLRAVWRSGRSAYTVSLAVKYIRMAPLQQELYFEAAIVRVEGRRCYLAGSLQSADRTVTYAVGEGVWLESLNIDSINRRSFL